MKHVDLCSGIGGFALGFEWAGLSKPVMFCDVDPWCRKVLAKHWPDVPIEEDVKVLANEPERIPDCTILTAGYPCQPFSLAGERRGKEDDRHIWPHIAEIVAQKRPAWCVFENVYGHLSMGLDEVLLDLEAQGYATRPFIVPACAVDAPHKRDRIWIVARNVANTTGRERKAGAKESRAFPQGHADGREPNNSSGSGQNVADSESLHSNGSTKHTKQSERQVQQSGKCGCSKPMADSACQFGHERLNLNRDKEGKQSGLRSETGTSGQNVADSDSNRLEGQRQESSGIGEEQHNIGDTRWWKPEPAVGRVANGIPRRVDRLRGLGNAIVPQISMQIGLAIKEADK